MTALDAAAAGRTATNEDVKPADHWTLCGQLFLILDGGADAVHRAMTMRTRRGQRCHVPFVDVPRGRSMRATAIRRTSFPARAPRLRDAAPARKGRRLAMDRSPRGLQVVFQLLVFATQALPFGFRSAQVLAQPLDLLSLLVDDLLGVAWGRGLVALRHAAVMPNSRSKYKQEMRASLL